MNWDILLQIATMQPNSLLLIKKPLYFILSRISGKAKEQLSSHQFQNWNELKEKLKDLYQDKKHYVQLMEDLNNIKQNSGEGVENFFQRLENLLTKILSVIRQYTPNPEVIPGKIESVKEIALNRFVFHSLPQISQMLRWKDFNDLNTAYSAAIAEERALNMQKHTKPSFCKIYRKHNHDTSKCRLRSNYSNQPKPVNFNNYENKKSCKYCKKNGHTIDECWKLKNKKIQKNGEKSEQSVTKPINLNYNRPSVLNAPLKETISSLEVFEN